MENRLIKTFCFEEKNRERIVLSDPTKIRLNTENKAEPKLMLKGPKFSTDNNIFAETWFIEPNGVKEWQGFEIIFREGENKLELPAGTSIGVRIKTTLGHYWHNGTDWELAPSGSWNTDAEIRANIKTFPIATIGNRKIGIVLNLKTTDNSVTPEVFEVKLLGLFEVEYFDDMVYDSVLRLLNKDFRATSFLKYRNGTSSISSISLDSVLANKDYNVFDVEAVYDLTNDPLKLNNLHDSYVKGSLKQDGFTYELGTENFSQPLPPNAIFEIRFKYVPEISVKRNQDYFEAPAYPHIIFHRITPVARQGFHMNQPNGQGMDFIRDKEAAEAVQQQSPSQQSYRFEFFVYTHEIDQFTLLDALRRFFVNNTMLKTFALDNEHAMELVEEIDTVGNSQQNDTSGTNLARGSFDVLGLLIFDKPSIDVPLVTELNVEAGIQ